MAELDIICEWCTKTKRKRIKTGCPIPRFCDRSCSARWRMSRPEYVAKLNTERRIESSRATMRTLRVRPDVAAKLDAHLHGESNPFRNSAVRARSVATNRAQGWRHLNGGNGRGDTQAQILLSRLLGWPTEVVVRTGQRGPLPTHYKLDVASIADMVAIECDGRSHRTRQIQERDARKDEFLISCGWTVLRFSNEQILIETAAVLAAVKCSTSRLAPVTT